MFNPAARTKTSVPRVNRPVAPENDGVPRVVPPPVTKGPVEVLQLRAQFTLEGGGDASAIAVFVHKNGQCGTYASLNAGIDGHVCFDVTERTSYLMMATAPGHAFVMRSFDLSEGEQAAPAFLVLPRALEYSIDVVDLDLSAREIETRRVRAGNDLHDLLLSQDGTALRASPHRVECQVHSLGKRPLEPMPEIPELVGPGAACDFELTPGAVFAVHAGARWFAVRLKEPGYQPPSVAADAPRRVIVGRSSTYRSPD